MVVLGFGDFVCAGFNGEADGCNGSVRFAAVGFLAVESVADFEKPKAAFTTGKSSDGENAVLRVNGSHLRMLNRFG